METLTVRTDMSILSTPTNVILGVSASPNLKKFASKSQLFIFSKLIATHSIV